MLNIQIIAPLMISSLILNPSYAMQSNEDEKNPFNGHNSTSYVITNKTTEGRKRAFKDFFEFFGLPSVQALEQFLGETIGENHGFAASKVIDAKSLDKGTSKPKLFNALFPTLKMATGPVVMSWGGYAGCPMLKIGYTVSDTDSDTENFMIDKDFLSRLFINPIELAETSTSSSKTIWDIYVDTNSSGKFFKQESDEDDDLHIEWFFTDINKSRDYPTWRLRYTTQVENLGKSFIELKQKNVILSLYFGPFLDEIHPNPTEAKTNGNNQDFCNIL